MWVGHNIDDKRRYGIQVMGEGISNLGTIQMSGLELKALMDLVHKLSRDAIWNAQVAPKPPIGAPRAPFHPDA